MTKKLNAERYKLNYQLYITLCMRSYYFVAVDSSFTPRELSLEVFKVVPFHNLSVGAVFGAMGLGFCLSLLFFMDQNISAALVNAQQNK